MAAKVQENGEVCSTGDDLSSLLPHLESWDRMLKLPVVDATWQQTQNVYGRVKGRFPCFVIPRSVRRGKNNRALVIYCFGDREHVVAAF